MLKRMEFAGADGVMLVADVGGGDFHSGASGVHSLRSPVILLHGGGQTRSSWGTVAGALTRRGYSVVALDARGHGESGWGEGDKAYSLDAFIADLRAVVATFDRPPILVGASLGGITAATFVGESTTPVARALVMVDVTPSIDPKGGAAIRDFMGGNPDGFADLEEAMDAVAAYLPHRPRPKDGSGLLRNLRRAENGRLYWHWDPNLLAGMQQGISSQSRVAAAVSRVTIPTLLVRGMKSEIVNDEGVREFRQMLPDAEIVEISGAHHMVAGDRNDAFNESILDFLARKAPAMLDVEPAD